MRKRLILGAAGAALLLAGCGHDNFRDVENVPSKNPDSIVVYSNVDENPNIAKLCIDGVGFATTTRDYTSVMRVPEWDAECQAVKK